MLGKIVLVTQYNGLQLKIVTLKWKLVCTILIMYKIQKFLYMTLYKIKYVCI